MNKYLINVSYHLGINKQYSLFIFRMPSLNETQLISNYTQLTIEKLLTILKEKSAIYKTNKILLSGECSHLNELLKAEGYEPSYELNYEEL